MTSKSITLADALANLNIIDDNAQQTFTVSGQRPDEIANHVVAREEIILGISPSDFVKEHPAVAFDYIKLQNDFRTICEDYENDLIWETKSKALQFCSKILFELGIQ